MMGVGKRVGNGKRGKVRILLIVHNESDRVRGIAGRRVSTFPI